MLTREEGERLASAVSALRPDWPTSSLYTFIGQRKERPYRDLALELVYVALDPKTETPARIDEDGPWKQLARTVRPAVNLADITTFDNACSECLKPREHLWHGGTGTVHDHEFREPTETVVPMPDHIRQHIQQEDK